jgi:hypothetical protein
MRELPIILGAMLQIRALMTCQIFTIKKMTMLRGALQKPLLSTEVNLSTFTSCLAYTQAVFPLCFANIHIRQYSGGQFLYASIWSEEGATVISQVCNARPFLYPTGVWRYGHCP